MQNTSISFLCTLKKVRESFFETVFSWKKQAEKKKLFAKNLNYFR